MNGRAISLDNENRSWGNTSDYQMLGASNLGGGCFHLNSTCKPQEHLAGQVDLEYDPEKQLYS